MRPLLFDTTGPVVTINNKPSAKDGSASVSLSASATDAISRGGLDYTYCTTTGVSTSLSCVASSSTSSNTSISISSGTLNNYYYIKFKAVDKLGNASTADYTWQRTGCTPGAKEVPAMANGVANERTCKSDGSYPVATVASCVSGYHEESGGCKFDSKTCDPDNAEAGSGTLTWDKTNKKWLTTCQLSGCNGGYDDDDDNNVCSVTALNYYSPSKEKGREACTGNPSDSEWKGTGRAGNLGASSGSDCEWTCEGRYSEYDGACYVPSKVCTSSELSGVDSNANAGTSSYSSDGKYGTCVISSCEGGYTRYGQTCYENSKVCTSSELSGVDSNADAGTRSYSSDGLYSSCVISSCVNNYTLYGQTCYAQSKTCTSVQLTGVNAKTGTVAYISDGAYGTTCTPISCEADYHMASGVCESDKADCSGEITNGGGERTWDTSNAGGWPTSCTVTVCAGGYDNAADSSVCGETPKGSYSEANNRLRASCLSTTTIPLASLPSNANWDSGPGLALESACSWACDTGYKKNTGGTLCESGESVTSFEISSLTSLGSGNKATSSRSLTLSISATDVSKWYVTHDSSATYDDKSDISTWSGTKPTGYTLPSSGPGAVSDGDVTLYLWVAGLDGKVKTSRTASATFTFDTTGPVITINNKPSSKDGSASASLSASATDAISRGGLDYTYCTTTGVSTSLSCVASSSTSSNTSISISSGAVNNYYYIKFKVVDKLGNASTSDYTWQRTGCTPGDKEVPLIANGFANERICKLDGSYPVATVASCVSGYHEESGVCKFDSKSCDPANAEAGSGTLTWDTTRQEMAYDMSIIGL